MKRITTLAVTMIVGMAVGWLLSCRHFYRQTRATGQQVDEAIALIERDSHFAERLNRQRVSEFHMILTFIDNEQYDLAASYMRGMIDIFDEDISPKTPNQSIEATRDTRADDLECE